MASKRFWILTAVLLFSHSFAAAEEIERFNRIEVWRLRVTWHCTHHDSQVNDHPASETIETLTQRGDLSGSVDFKLVKSRDSNANFYQWHTLDEEAPAGQIAFTAENATQSKNKRTGQSSWFKMAANAGGIGDGGARLTIDARTKTFRVNGYASSAEGQYEQSTSMGSSARSPMGVNLSTGSGDWEGDLPQQGMAITGGIHQVTCNAPIVLAGRPMEVSWTLEPWKEEDLPEVWVEPPGDFAQWRPEGNWQHPEQPGNQVTVYIRVHAKGDRSKPAKAELQLSLPYTSEEKGVCLNWPADGTSQHKDLRLRQEDQADPRIRVKDDTHAETVGEVEDVTVVVSAFDYGAWGTLRVSGTRSAQGLPVKVCGKDTPDLDIPLDDNGNRIADDWEAKEGVSGYPASWDGAEVPGQTAKGDGLELYAKYRGLLALTAAGGREHVRPPAREKCHFVIDPAGIFDLERWQRTAGIRAYRLDATLTRERRVDFNAAAVAEGKFAVQLDMTPGTIEPDPWPDDPNAGDNPGQWAYTVGDSPRETERCRLFPDRVKGMMERVMAKMRKALAHPEAPENAGELAVLKSLGRPLEQIEARLAAIDAAEVERLVRMMMELSAIHEMAHACGVDGHRNAKNQEDDNLGRSPQCPMNYLNQKGRRLYILDGVLGGDGRFCEAAPDTCWAKLNVKN